ncbi:MAG TPA: S41 family peptidase [Gemmatimonadales bacterium]|nr:S41 family peptidase [Gemmatimonadales bacterium]
MRFVLPVILVLAVSSPVVAQSSSGGPDTTIDRATRARVVDGVLQRVNQGYIFPEKVAGMSKALRERMKRGDYDRITSARAFADTLTRDLQAASRDKHLEVSYQSRGVLDEPPDAEPPPEERRARAAYARRVNYGFERVERLAGNVGYLEIRSFNFEAAALDSTLAAAMNFLANTDALIIDVRRNGGGEPAMVAAVCSYLLPADLLINKFYWRPQNRWDEFRTGSVSGRHYGTTRPVYVLTSDQTFSGAEEFAYDLLTQRRGVVVGDTTGGGAHPGGMRRVTEQFGVWVPSGRAVNPVTGTNWEGTGVRPDVPVAAADALRTAHLRALELLLAAERNAEYRTGLQRAIDDLRRD